MSFGWQSQQILWTILSCFRTEMLHFEKRANIKVGTWNLEKAYGFYQNSICISRNFVMCSDVSDDCNDPVSQSGRSVLTLMRSRALCIILFVKSKAFWLMGKIWGFVLQRIKYQRLFYWQQHLEILFRFRFMKIYKLCLVSNIY